MMILGSITQYVNNMFGQQKAQEKTRERLAAATKVKTPDGLKEFMASNAAQTSRVKGVFINEEQAQRVSDALDALAAPDNDGQRMSTISMKMDTGIKLSPGELAYLKDKDPELYAKAMRIEKERKDYAEALRNCRTKEEATAVKLNKMTSLAGRMPVGNNPDDNPQREEICQTIAAVNNEFKEYAHSERYKQLPADEKEAEERKKHPGRRVTRHGVEPLDTEDIPLA